MRRAIQRDIEDALSEKILYGELGAGEIVSVGVEGEGRDATFTFTGTRKEPAEPVLPSAGEAGGSSGEAHSA